MSTVRYCDKVIYHGIEYLEYAGGIHLLSFDTDGASFSCLAVADKDDIWGSRTGDHTGHEYFFIFSF